MRLAPAALRDLEPLHEFLRPKSPQAARRAAAVIERLEQHPRKGRLVEDTPPEYRELPIEFGAAG